MSQNNSNQQPLPHEHHKSEGRKLHKDWRLWLMVGLMLAAILIYLATLDLR
jgi:hypothetical protein